MRCRLLAPAAFFLSPSFWQCLTGRRKGGDIFLNKLSMSIAQIRETSQQFGINGQVDQIIEDIMSSFADDLEMGVISHETLNKIIQDELHRSYPDIFS